MLCKVPDTPLQRLCERIVNVQNKMGEILLYSSWVMASWKEIAALAVLLLPDIEFTNEGTFFFLFLFLAVSILF